VTLCLRSELVIGTFHLRSLSFTFSFRLSLPSCTRCSAASALIGLRSMPLETGGFRVTGFSWPCRQSYARVQIILPWSKNATLTPELCRTACAAEFHCASRCPDDNCGKQAVFDASDASRTPCPSLLATARTGSAITAEFCVVQHQPARARKMRLAKGTSFHGTPYGVGLLVFVSGSTEMACPPGIIDDFANCSDD